MSGDKLLKILTDNNSFQISTSFYLSPLHPNMAEHFDVHQHALFIRDKLQSVMDVANPNITSSIITGLPQCLVSHFIWWSGSTLTNTSQDVSIFGCLNRIALLLTDYVSVRISTASFLENHTRTALLSAATRMPKKVSPWNFVLYKRMS